MPEAPPSGVSLSRRPRNETPRHLSSVKTPGETQPRQSCLASSPGLPTRQAIAAQDRSLPGRVTGKLRKAIEAMVWEGASRKEAAQRADLSDHGLRQALRRAHVLAHYRRECEVLRTSGRAKRLHRLEELAAQDENRNAAVAAIKVAEQLGDEQATSGKLPQAAGLVIVIVPPATGAEPKQTIIDAQPIMRQCTPADEGE